MSEMHDQEGRQVSPGCPASFVEGESDHAMDDESQRQLLTAADLRTRIAL